jgi:ribose transport system substrate-binding protein
VLGGAEEEANMKKLVALIAALAVVGGASFGQSAATKKIKVGVTMPTADHGWMGGANWWAKKAIDDWKKKDSNVEFIFKTSGDVTKQVADIEDMLVQGVNGLVIFPFESAPLTPVVEKAYGKGVYIVVLDRGVTKPVYDVYLSNDDESYARQAMEWICKDLNYKGNIVLIEGVPSVISDLRTNTAKAVAAKYPGIKVLDSQPGNWNKEKALSVMENYLAKYKSIDAVYTADDDMLEGALQAYKESGRKDVKIMFGGAAKKELVKRIIDGDPLVRANATYPPDVCATAVSLAVVGLRGRVFEGFYQKKLPLRIILASELITRENAKGYYVPEAVF